MSDRLDLAPFEINIVHQNVLFRKRCSVRVDRVEFLRRTDGDIHLGIHRNPAQFGSADHDDDLRFAVRKRRDDVTAHRRHRYVRRNEGNFPFIRLSVLHYSIDNCRSIRFRRRIRIAVFILPSDPLENKGRRIEFQVVSVDGDDDRLFCLNAGQIKADRRKYDLRTRGHFRPDDQYAVFKSHAFDLPLHGKPGGIPGNERYLRFRTLIYRIGHGNDDLVRHLFEMREISFFKHPEFPVECGEIGARFRIVHGVYIGKGLRRAAAAVNGFEFLSLASVVHEDAVFECRAVVLTDDAAHKLLVSPFRHGENDDAVAHSAVMHLGGNDARRIIFVRVIAESREVIIDHFRIHVFDDAVLHPVGDQSESVRRPNARKRHVPHDGPAVHVPEDRPISVRRIGGVGIWFDVGNRIAVSVEDTREFDGACRLVRAECLHARALKIQIVHEDVFRRHRFAVRADSEEICRSAHGIIEVADDLYRQQHRTVDHDFHCRRTVADAGNDVPFHRCHRRICGTDLETFLYLFAVERDDDAEIFTPFSLFALDHGKFGRIDLGGHRIIVGADGDDDLLLRIRVIQAVHTNFDLCARRRFFPDGKHVAVQHRVRSLFRQRVQHGKTALNGDRHRRARKRLVCRLFGKDLFRDLAEVRIGGFVQRPADKHRGIDGFMQFRQGGERSARRKRAVHVAVGRLRFLGKSKLRERIAIRHARTAEMTPHKSAYTAAVRHNFSERKHRDRVADVPVILGTHRSDRVVRVPRRRLIVHHRAHKTVLHKPVIGVDNPARNSPFNARVEHVEIAHHAALADPAKQRAVATQCPFIHGRKIHDRISVSVEYTEKSRRCRRISVAVMSDRLDLAPFEINIGGQFVPIRKSVVHRRQIFRVRHFDIGSHALLLLLIAIGHRNIQHTALAGRDRSVGNVKTVARNLRFADARFLSVLPEHQTEIDLFAHKDEFGKGGKNQLVHVRHRDGADGGKSFARVRRDFCRTRFQSGDYAVFHARDRRIRRRPFHRRRSAVGQRRRKGQRFACL